jgi:hypothetical protein
MEVLIRFVTSFALSKEETQCLATLALVYEYMDHGR